jgi:hypothetical protein
MDVQPHRPLAHARSYENPHFPESHPQLCIATISRNGFNPRNDDDNDLQILNTEH